MIYFKLHYFFILYTQSFSFCTFSRTTLVYWHFWHPVLKINYKLYKWPKQSQFSCGVCDVEQSAKDFCVYFAATINVFFKNKFRKLQLNFGLKHYKYMYRIMVRCTCAYLINLMAWRAVVHQHLCKFVLHWIMYFLHHNIPFH